MHVFTLPVASWFMYLHVIFQLCVLGHLKEERGSSGSLVTFPFGAVPVAGSRQVVGPPSSLTRLGK
jgi:hypothetical protein